MIGRLRRHLRRLVGDRSAAAMVEFAISLPAMMLLLLAGVDLARLVIVNQKLDRVATAMGDLVAQAQTISSADMTNIYAATSYIASPFDFQHNGVVIVSSVSLVNNKLHVNWQSRGSGNLTTASKIGVSGGNASLPSGLTVAGTDTLITAEVYFNFTPFFGLSLVPGAQLYHTAYFRPRLGSLNTLN
jgi:Flp pilus assembly protein TadG